MHDADTTCAVVASVFFSHAHRHFLFLLILLTPHFLFSLFCHDLTDGNGEAYKAGD
jgi:hypothetical protein